MYAIPDWYKSKYALPFPKRPTGNVIKLYEASCFDDLCFCCQSIECTNRIGWPNPANGQLTILDASTGSAYRILNSSEAIVQSAQLNSEMQQIDISKLSPGLYLLQVGGLKGVKFVKE